MNIESNRLMKQSIGIKSSNGSFTKRLLNDIVKNRYVYIMAIPIIMYYFIFHYIPMGGTVIAFQDYLPIKGIWKSDWVGFKHFINFLTGPHAVRLIRNTVFINLYDIFFGFPFPILLALMINEVKDGLYKKTIQTVSYMPHFISLVVMCGMIVDFSRSTGLFNIIAETLGVEATNLLTQPNLFRTIFVSSGIWKSMGWGSIIYIATLSSVDQSMYEAASIDGAGRIKQIIHITFPALIPVMTIQLILRIGNIMSLGFEKIILLYNPLVYETADVISSYVYRRGLEEMNYSVGAAVGLFNSVINIFVLFSVNWFSRKYIKESLW